MRDIRDILVAVDLGPGSAGALAEGLRVARAFGARLRVLHVIPLKAVPEFGDDEAGRSAPARRLGGLLARELPSPPPESILRVGEPSRELLAAVGELRPDLVVLGVRSRSALDLLLRGSRVERAIRESPVPVWVAQPRRARSIRRVLCGVDPARGAEEEVAAAVAVARRFGARLDLVRVLDGPDADLAAARRELRDLAARAPSGGLRIETLVWGGGRRECLVTAAEVRDVDLLVLGCAGRRGLARWLRGNLAEEVVRRVACSLLVVPVAAPDALPRSQATQRAVLPG
ncbi:MAG: universal stress protein [Planctomycetota bacterium]